jgi:hypothetical protein
MLENSFYRARISPAPMRTCYLSSVTKAEPEKIYRALWKTLQVAGAEPCYYSPECLRGLDLEGGRYVANAERAHGKPEIRLTRTPVSVEPYEPDIDHLSDEALLAELCTLAHGHFRSDRAGNTWRHPIVVNPVRLPRF